MANELTVINYDIQAMIDAQEVMSAYREELGDDAKPEFAVAKTPSSGMTAWSIKSNKDDDDPEITKTIEGVIIHSYKRNAYWSEPMEANTGAMPDCSSNDGVTAYDSILNQACVCKGCPRNEFGSDGRGKACKNSRVIYIMREGDMMPIKVMLAPTGLTPYDKYVEELLIPKKRGQRPTRPIQVITKIGLKVETSKTGQKYSVPTFEAVGRLPEDVRANMEAYALLLKDLDKKSGFTEYGDTTPFDA